MADRDEDNLIQRDNRPPVPVPASQRWSCPWAHAIGRASPLSDHRGRSLVLERVRLFGFTLAPPYIAPPIGDGHTFWDAICYFLHHEGRGTIRTDEEETQRWYQQRRQLTEQLRNLSGEGTLAAVTGALGRPLHIFTSAESNRFVRVIQSPTEVGTTPILLARWSDKKKVRWTSLLPANALASASEDPHWTIQCKEVCDRPTLHRLSHRHSTKFKEYELPKKGEAHLELLMTVHPTQLYSPQHVSYLLSWTAARLYHTSVARGVVRGLREVKDAIYQLRETLADALLDAANDLEECHEAMTDDLEAAEDEEGFAGIDDAYYTYREQMDDYDAEADEQYVDEQCDYIEDRNSRAAQVVDREELDELESRIRELRDTAVAVNDSSSELDLSDLYLLCQSAERELNDARAMQEEQSAILSGRFDEDSDYFSRDLDDLLGFDAGDDPDEFVVTADVAARLEASYDAAVKASPNVDELDRADPKLQKQLEEHEAELDKAVTEVVLKRTADHLARLLQHADHDRLNQHSIADRIRILEYLSSNLPRKFPMRRAPSLYFLFADSQLVYIGLTTNAHARYRNHAALRKVTDLFPNARHTIRLFAVNLDSKPLEWLDSKGGRTSTGYRTLESIEQILIHFFQPVLNTDGLKKMKGGSDEARERISIVLPLALISDAGKLPKRAREKTDAWLLQAVRKKEIDPEPEQPRSLIEPSLHRLGLIEVKTSPNGNCLYSAVMQQLALHQVDVSSVLSHGAANVTSNDLREHVAAAIMSRTAEFQPAFPGVDIQAMAQQLRQDGDWDQPLGDAVLQVLARLLCVRIRVLSTTGSYVIVDNAPDASSHPLLTVVLRDHHYSGTLPRQA